jgi:signal transduction histidine kinase
MSFEYKTVFMALDDPVAVFKKPDEIRHVNPAFERHFGPVVALDAGLLSLFADPEDAELIPWEYSSGDETPHQCILKTADGGLVRAEIKLNPGTDQADFALIKLMHSGSSNTISHPADVLEAIRSFGTFDLCLKNHRVQISGVLAYLFGIGRTSGEIGLKDWIERVHHSERTQALKKLTFVDKERSEPLVLTLRMKGLEPDSYTWLRYALHVDSSSEDPEASRLHGTVHDVTELVRTEQALETTRTTSERLIDLCGITRWQFDFETGVGTISGPMAKFFTDGSRFSPTNWRGLVHPDDASHVRAAFAALELGVQLDTRFRLSNGQGAWIDTLIIGAPEPGPERGVRRVSGIVSHANMAESFEDELVPQSLSQNDEAENTWSLNMVDGELTVTGPILARLGFDTESQTFTLDAWKAHMHEDDRILLEEFETGPDIGSNRMYEYRLRAADGEVFWVSAQGRIAQQSSAGRTILYSGLIKELSTTRAVDLQIAARERVWANAVNAALLGVWTLPRTGITQGMRGKVLDWLGRSDQDSTVTNEEMWAIVHPDDHDAISFQARRLFTDSTPLNVEMRMLSPDGWKWVRVVGDVIETRSDGRPVLASGVYIDISQERRYRDQLKSHAEEHERINRDLEQFTSIASHDLKDPLNKISALSTLLKTRYENELGDDAIEILTYLVKASTRMRGLIDDLLDYSRTTDQSMVLGSVDLNDILDETLDELATRLDEIGGQMLVDPIPVLYGEPVFVRIVANNLISNAIKYRSPSRRLELQVTSREIDGMVETCFADNGIGIEPENFDKIFDPFERGASASIEGNGLGLALCRQAVERMGGHIWVESALDNGSKFFVSLPSSSQQANQDVA